MEKLIFEYSQPGRRAHTLPDAPAVTFGLPERKSLRLPEVSEVDVVRHFTRLSRQNYGVDSGFYPLGSCTMKYNPKINEDFAQKYADKNPNLPDSAAQDILRILYETEQMLCKVFGYAGFTLQPAAGANGEFTGLLIIRAYHLDRGDVKRVKILVPDAAHGTNPASCTLAGFQTVTIKSLPDGGVDIADLKKHLDDTVAGLMLTNPNTLGLFEKNILQIAELVHAAGGLLYYDGANANATLGIARPADMGFDVCHINLHKTFAAPHGGGGPGSGPVGVAEKLIPYLPYPRIDYARQTESYLFKNDLPKSIGKVHSFYGNIGVILKAYAYLKIQGSAGLRRASELAVLNANYVKARLNGVYDFPYPQICKHEFVISLKEWKKQYGITAADFAKRLMDYGYHPPTVYFPLIVPECLMIEPTETESKAELDAFCEAMLKIAEEIKTDPALVKSAPHKTIVGRLDEVKAVKEPDLNYFEAK